MTTTVMPGRGHCDIVIAGDIDAEHAELLADALGSAVTSHHTVVVHLDGVEVFGSAASRELHKALDLATARGSSLRFEGVPAHISVVLEAIGLRDSRIAVGGSHTMLDFNAVISQGVVRSKESVCITTGDPDEPSILYVNDAFTALTGHDRNDVIGANPRMLQGPLTDRVVIERLKQSLRTNDDFIGEAINYKADGTPFWMNWRIHTVTHGSATFFMALQHDRTRLRHFDRLETARLRMHRTLQRSKPLPKPQDVLEALSDAVAVVVESNTAVISAAMIDDDGMLLATNLEGAVNEPVITRRQSVHGADAAALHLPFDIGRSRSGYLAVEGLHPDWLYLIDVSSLDELCQTAGLHLRNTE